MTTAPSARTSPVTHMATKPAAHGAQDRPLIWIDGQLYPKSEAKISVFDHGFLYGDGCFEGIRVYKGKIFKCARHLARIFRNAERLRMKMPWSPKEVEAMMRECIEANGLSDGYIRLIFSRGVGTLGLDPRKCPKPSCICIADQIMLYPPELYAQGMKVVIAKRPRTPTECLDPTLKSLNYLNNILAKCEAIDAGCLEAILLSTDGYVGECSGDNLFIVKNGEVFTSPLDVGMLDGIKHILSSPYLLGIASLNEQGFNGAGLELAHQVGLGLQFGVGLGRDAGDDGDAVGIVAPLGHQADPRLAIGGPPQLLGARHRPRQSLADTQVMVRHRSPLPSRSHEAPTIPRGRRDGRAVGGTSLSKAGRHQRSYRAAGSTRRQCRFRPPHRGGRPLRPRSSQPIPTLVKASYRREWP